jgi:hypothetical protein
LRQWLKTNPSRRGPEALRLDEKWRSKMPGAVRSSIDHPLFLAKSDCKFLVEADWYPTHPYKGMPR